MEQAWLPTFTNKVVNVLDLQPTDINAYDIAWGLSNAIRVGGQSKVPWDVLSHTGLAYMLYVRDQVGHTDPMVTLSLLLHDASEAYIGDMLSTLKKSLVGEAFAKLEDRVLRTIFERFGLDIDGCDWLLIDRYDKQACYIELQRLHPECASDPRFQGQVYPMATTPVLAKAKIPDYIEFIKGLAINRGVSDVAALFELPEASKAYLTVEPVVVDNLAEIGESPSDDDIAAMRS